MMGYCGLDQPVVVLKSYVLSYGWSGDDVAIECLKFHCGPEEPT